MHYSRKVKRGARRFASQSSANDLQHIAFENMDGGKILILTNSGPARTVQVQLAGMAAAVPMKSDSVATLTWGTDIRKS